MLIAVVSPGTSPWVNQKRVVPSPCPSRNSTPRLSIRGSSATAASSPSSRSTAVLRGSSDSPMWKRGKRVRSRSLTRSPARAITSAAVAPAGPPPMTIAS